MRLTFVPALLVASRAEAFVPGWGTTTTSSATNHHQPRAATKLAFTTSNALHSSINVPSTTVLYAKKKKGPAANAKLAALDALDSLALDPDAPLSKKEQKALEKQKKKEEAAAAKAAADSATEAANPPAAGGKKNAKEAALAALDGLEDDDQPLTKKEQKALQKQQEMEAKAVGAGAGEEIPAKPMSKKDEMLMKALAMEEEDNRRQAEADAAAEDAGPKLSKKELKALQKKEEKMAAKAQAKAEKKAARAAEFEAAAAEVQAAAVEGANGEAVNGDAVNGAPSETAAPHPPPPKLTLEDKIRKERPPPRIRVMEGAQPGYVALRLENIGMMFRNQAVLNDVTWGVQTGERIGLVGKNGAGKTTQLRILAGELEPTTGDVVKSSGDLRTAMLRQEFVEELVPERTLKEEFMAVFEEENKILSDLKEAEMELERMGSSDVDADKMQEILDRMQELQNLAEDKDVYILESRVKKTMDLMGFTDDEADDLVASFSGGWKMRIGLGKVLLKDPNILLLGK